MTNNIRMMLKCCTKIPSAADARQLARDYRAGDQSARDKLITGNLPLVVKMVQAFRVPLQMHDDAFSEGVLGLMRAVEDYDPDHESGACFCTLARYWVMQKVQRFMRSSVNRWQHETAIGVDLRIEIEHNFTTDVDTAPLLAKLTSKERKTLEQITLNATLVSIADEMQLSKERVRQIRNRAIEKLREMVR